MHKRNFVNKQPGSTRSTSINGSRSCYMTTKRFPYLSVGTILDRAIDISNNILDRFWALFKNLNPLNKRQKNRSLFVLQKEYCAPGTQTRIADIDNRFAKRVKSVFVQAKFTQTLFIWTIHVPNENNSAIVIPTVGGECTTHCNCSQKCPTCKQQKIDSCRDV